MTPADITVVIPALNEQSAIRQSVFSPVSAGATEVLVSDGGLFIQSRYDHSDIGWGG